MDYVLYDIVYLNHTNKTLQIKLSLKCFTIAHHEQNWHPCKVSFTSVREITSVPLKSEWFTSLCSISLSADTRHWIINNNITTVQLVLECIWSHRKTMNYIYKLCKNIFTVSFLLWISLSTLFTQTLRALCMLRKFYHHIIFWQY